MEPDTSSIPDESCVQHFYAGKRDLDRLAMKLEIGGLRAITEAEVSRAIGHFWLSRRQSMKLEGLAVAKLVDVRADQLAAFERGHLSFKDLSPDFLPRLAVALGDIEVFDRFVLELGQKAFEFSDIRDHTL